MTARILDGKALAQTIQEEIARAARELKEKHNITPGLATILVGDDPASHIYVKNKGKACEKVGFFSKSIILPQNTSQQYLTELIGELNANPAIHGILVQLPLPQHIDENSIINAVHPEKDIDGFHPVNLGKMVLGREDCFLPCTPFGIQMLLARSGIETQGRHVVIVGRSNTVGKPTAIILMQKAAGADATVTVCHSRTKDLPAIIRQGDIVIAAIGRAEFIKADMVKPGAVVIDVGINRIKDFTKKSGYTIVGDVEFEKVKEVASAITPVPGGIGPMTIAMLLFNTLKAAKKQSETPTRRDD
jgi:methylenetetrahydrofolate dehydrogenase (NADP+)/methenyltetrahydrofolate cyclohydrolase